VSEDEQNAKVAKLLNDRNEKRKELERLRSNARGVSKALNDANAELAHYGSADRDHSDHLGVVNHSSHSLLSSEAVNGLISDIERVENDLTRAEDALRSFV